MLRVVPLRFLGGDQRLGGVLVNEVSETALALPPLETFFRVCHSRAARPIGRLVRSRGIRISSRLDYGLDQSKPIVADIV